MPSKQAPQQTTSKHDRNQPRSHETETSEPSDLRSDPNIVFHLQRMIGNTAVQRWLAGSRPDARMVSHLQRIMGNAAVQRWLDNTHIQRDAAIHAGEGTTEDLRKELVRLQTEAQSASGDEEARYQMLIQKLVSRIAERGNSSLPDSPIDLYFDGRTLVASGSVSFSYPAVSGTPDASGQFDYSPERQRMENAGPIPEGVYWVDPTQVANLWYYVGKAARSWGSHRLTIHPFDTTHTFGRGGFFIHGGAVPGSIGCIDLTSNIGTFVEQVLKHPDALGAKIKLRVHYPVMGDFPAPSGTEAPA